MKVNIFKKALVMLMAAALVLGLFPAGGSAVKANAASKSVTVCDLICDSSVSDAEISELQKARLCGLVPDALAGDVNRNITIPEFKLLLASLMKYEGEEQPENFTWWLNSEEEGYLTREEAANSFLNNYHFALNREYGINLAVSMTNSLPYSSVAECLDPAYGGGTKEGYGKYNYYIFFIANFDQYSGAPLMDRSLDGYLRLNDPMTVKEAIQLVYRYSNSHLPDTEVYISLKDAAAGKLILSEDEHTAADLIPEPTYEKLPAYQGAWYNPVIGRSDVVFEDDFSMISDMGFNYLRYDIFYDQFMNQKGEIKKSVLEALDKAIRYAVKYGFHINLDLSPATDLGTSVLIYLRDGIKTPVEGGVNGFTSTCTARQYRDYCKNIVRTFAERYADVPNSILSFQLFTEEPVDDQMSEWAPDQFVSEALYTEVVYELADAIWEKDDDRLIVTGGTYYDTYPCTALAEEGIKRNQTSGGKERRILQNFHMFVPNYCWTSGFYGEMPSANLNPDYIPKSLYKETSLTVKGPTAGFKAGTTVKIRDENRNIDKLKLTAYKDGTVVDTPAGKEGAGNKYVTYTFSADADTFILTNTGEASPMSDNYIYYIWITYPEKAEKKIPIFGYYMEDSYEVYGDGGYDAYVKMNSNGLASAQDLMYSTVLYFTDRKTTFLTVGGDEMRTLQKKAEKNGETINYDYANTTVQIKDGNDYADYTATFKDYTGQDDKTYRLNDDDLIKAFIDNWKEFAAKYGTVPMQHEMGPDNGSRKEVLYAYSERWLKAFTDAGWPWGGIAHPNENGALYDDYIWQGDYVKYDFHRTDVTQLKIYQKYMKRFDIDDIGTAAYTGEEIKPALSVKYKGTKLTLGTDYDITYHDDTEPGTATAVVTGKGKYEGIFSVQRYFIVKESIKTEDENAGSGTDASEADQDGQDTGSESQTPGKVTLSDGTVIETEKTESKKGGFTETVTTSAPDGSSTVQKATVDAKGKVKLSVTFTNKKGSTLTETFVSDGSGLALKTLTTKLSTADVPESFMIDGAEYKVTTINAKFMNGNKKTKTLILPASVSKVKKNAFKGASALKTIKVGPASKKEFKSIKALLTKSGVKSKIKIKQVKK